MARDREAWIGVDEAGYGPNIGPLCMAAVGVWREAEPNRNPDPTPTPRPDLWRFPGVDRAGGAHAALWIDDSKRLTAARRGRERLEAGFFALIDAAGGTVSRDLPASARFLGWNIDEEPDWNLWTAADTDPNAAAEPETNPDPDANPALAHSPRLNPFWNPADGGNPLRAGLQAEGSALFCHLAGLTAPRFNARLAHTGSKAAAHFEVFAQILRRAWLHADAVFVDVLSDQHGGRRRYADGLRAAFPEAHSLNIHEEGPQGGAYSLRMDHRTLRVAFRPRSDSSDGLTALASIAAKTIREWWMDRFNAHWARRCPGLAPTAGYPTDARRFLEAAAHVAHEDGIAPDQWWRRK